MENNEYYLELPEHLRHLVAKDAPRRVAAIRFETEILEKSRPFLAGAWPLIADDKSNDYGVQIFITLAEGKENPFLRLDSWSRCASQVEYTNLPLEKLRILTREIHQRTKIVRHCNIDNIGSELELWANQWLHNEGRWKQPDWLNYTIMPFRHRIFNSHREFIELPDNVMQVRLLADLQQEGREISRARRWINMEKTERETDALSGERGTWNEIEEFLKNLMWIMLARFPTQSGLSWHIYSEANPDFSWIYPGDDESIKVKERWLPRIKIWREKILQHVQPKYLPYQQKNSTIQCIDDSMPLCVNIWFNRRPRISVATPTAHELIEAQLRLSEWAHKNLSPEEAEALLQFD